MENGGYKKDNSLKQEGILSIIAAIVVLFSAMWNPIISIIISVAILLLFAIYRFIHG
ncbi:MAG: hypothetical protein ACFE75_06545 [Candidatus Hodarchaeota archaeon]